MLSRQIKNQKPKYRIAYKDSRFENDRMESEPIRSPQNIRVVQSHLVYVIGLKPSICDEETLVSKEYFGKYGTVSKVVINKRGSSNRKYYKDISYAAHITYDDEISASLAVISLFEFKYHEFIMRSCYGYTKYCENFYYGRDCYKTDCVYLHQFQSEQEIVAGQACDKQRQRMNFEKQLHLALKIIYKNRKQVIQTWRDQKQLTDQFPDPYQSMKALVTHGYMTEQQYEKQWEIEDNLKCYTESTQTSPIKQQESDYEKPYNEHPPQQQNFIEQSEIETQNEQSVSSSCVNLSSMPYDQQINTQSGAQQKYRKGNIDRHTKSKFQFVSPSQEQNQTFRHLFEKELLFKV